MKAALRTARYFTTSSLVDMIVEPRFSQGAVLRLMRFGILSRGGRFGFVERPFVSPRAGARNIGPSGSHPARRGLDFPGISWQAGGMPREVKICGLSDPESVEAALSAGADFVGFVFFSRSPRYVSPRRAGELAGPARGKAGIVALTVDADDALLAEIAEALKPDLMQLHGAEAPERIAAIGAAAGRPVMKAIGVAGTRDLATAADYGSAERLLLDAKPPRDAVRPGGNGAPFDWSILSDFFPAKPWFLSGGLNAANVAAAVRATGAPGVDVSSGVEISPGRKDPALIHAFVAAVRAIDEPRRLAG